MMDDKQFFNSLHNVSYTHDYFKRQHALLESPTGTGKTLCLLCSVLAWREACLAKWNSDQNDTPHLQNALPKSITSFYSELDDQFSKSPPKIYFASRTHSQLSQALRELRNTRYKNVKVCILGSRDQMCINQEVTQAQNNATRTALCLSKVSKRSCEYYNNIETTKTLPEFQTRIFDMEDLVKFGNMHKSCPYYLSREQQTSADILFLPYNYLLDPATRSSQNLALENAILILDEAHNVESSCGEASSFDITTDDIAFAIHEIDTCIEYVNKGTVSCEVDVDDMLVLKQVILRLETYLVNFRLQQHSLNAMSGDAITTILANCGITTTNSHDISTVIDAITTTLANIREQQQQLRTQLSSTSSTTTLRGALKLINSALTNVIRLTSSDEQLACLKRFYKVHIGVGSEEHQSQRKKRTLSLWCFHSGMALQALMSSGVRNMIFTSGTLAPLDALMADFQMRFGVTLENPHVIARKNVFAAVVSKGPTGYALNSSFRNRENDDYRTELGHLILDVAKRVPGGLLVFFPSYTVLDQCTFYWKRAKYIAPGDVHSQNHRRSMYEEISNVKEIVLEPKDKHALLTVMQQYYEAIDKRNGAIFMAVCRGKVSEGVDFSNERGRAVIVTGLPFAPVGDAKVQLKKQFLDEQQHHQKSSALLSGNKQEMGLIQYLTGDAWYKQQASRAVNQALGRVLRHANDHGAILLCDERFANPQQQQQLPLWLRTYMNNDEAASKYPEIMTGLVSFFQVHTKQQQQRGASSIFRLPTVNNKRLYQGEEEEKSQPKDTDYVAESISLLKEPPGKFPSLQGNGKMENSSGNLENGRSMMGLYNSSHSSSSMYFSSQARPGLSKTRSLLELHEHRVHPVGRDSNMTRIEPKINSSTVISSKNIFKKNKTLMESLSDYSVEESDTTESVSKNAFRILRPDQPANPATENTAIPPAVSPAQQFVIRIKSKFSDDGYHDFKSLLSRIKEIQQQNIHEPSKSLENLKQWIDAIHALFVSENQVPLFKEFSCFVPSTIKSYYYELNN